MMKKLINISLVLIMLFGAISQNVIPVSAINENDVNYEAKYKVKQTSHNWSFMTRNGWSAYGEPKELYLVDGSGGKVDTVYCLEPAILVNSKKEYKIVSLEKCWNGYKLDGADYWKPKGYSISESTAYKLSLIVYYGNKKIEETGNIDWYAVTQNAVWKTLGWNNSWLKTSTHNNFNSMEKAIAQLEKAAADYEIQPSFDTSLHTIKDGETIRLTDTNKVLNTFKIYNDAGLDVKIEGNELVVTGTKKANSISKVTFIKDIPAEDTGVSLMLEGSSTQTVGLFYLEDPNFSEVNFNVENKVLELTKVNDAGNVAGEGFTFKIGKDLNGTEGTDWKTYTTNAQGKINIEGLKPGDTYYYQEIDCPDSYIKDSTIKSVIIPSEGDATITVKNNRYGEILLQKTNQDGVNLKNGFTFEFSYNADMSNPFATATTNGNGRLRVKNVIPGTVYYRETAVRTNDEWNYTLDPKIYSVKVEAGKTALADANIVFANVQDTRIEIIKKDSSTKEVLEGFTFKISANSDMSNPIGTYTTDANGTIVRNLPEGTYYIQETSGPDNYIINDTVHKVVTQAGKTSTLPVLNDKKGNLVLQKQNQNGENLGAGFTFEFSYNADMSNPFATETTNTNGQITLTNLLPQKVYYRETAVPTDGEFNYKLDNTIRSVDVKKATTETFYVANEQTGKIQIIKKDASTSEVLKGISFNISKNADMSSLIGNYTTDTNGIITKELDQGTYYVQETSTLDYLVLDATIHKVEVKAGETKQIELFNDRRGNLTLQKTNQEGVNLGQGFTFEFSYKEDMSDLIGTYTTDDNGQITLTNLLPQKVYYREKSVPTTGEYQYVIDTSVGFVEVKSNETTTKNVVNAEKGKFVLTKVDESTNQPIKGITFAISKNKDMTSSTECTTNEDGQIILDLAEGTYYVQETAVVDPYLLDSTIREVNITAGKDCPITITNTAQTGQIIITKEDAETGSNAQGQANLNGAVFEILKDDKSTVVEQLTADGRVAKSSTTLPLGTYYVREKIAPEGYTLNPELHKVTLTYDNTKQYVTGNATVKNEIITNTFTINKTVDQYLYGMKDLSGFVFKVYNSKNELVDTLTTNAEGEAISTTLIYDTYKVVEQEREGYKSVEPFTFKLDSDTQKFEFNIKNNILTAQLKIVKKDAETGKTVLLKGFTFKIIDPEGNYVKQGDTNLFVTNNDGIVILPELLKYGKGYQIEEVAVTGNYLLNNEKVNFTVDGTQAIIVKEVVNTPIHGQITVLKEGEVLIGYENGKFKYEIQPLKNTEFTIYAKEDIYTADNQGTLLYQKDAVVEVLTTGENGKASSKELPLGKYYVKETKIPHGFVESKEVKDVELTYKDAYTELVYDSETYTNDRQKVELKVIKKDIETGDTLNGAEFTLYAAEDIINVDGTVLVKAGETIETLYTSNNGTAQFKVDLPLDYDYVVCETKAPIGYASTDYEYKFNTDYQGQEVEVIELSTEFKNAITKVEVSKKDITNDDEIAGAHLTVYPKGKPGTPVDAWISGQDGTNEDGSIKPHLIKGLEVGKTYELKEVIAPYGYAIANKIEFIVKDTGEIQKVEMKDEMVFGQLKWKKTGEIFNETINGTSEFGETLSPVWNTANLIGAEITIYAAEDITVGNHTYFKVDDKVETLVSAKEDVTSSKLPVGKYYYIESKAPNGYLADTNKHYFEVKDSKVNELETIESILENTRSKVEIDMTKVLEEQEVFKNPEAYKDIIFGIYAREDIKDYYGEVRIPATSLIRVSGIDEEGHLVNVPDLPEGKYFIKELVTNSQYVLNDTEYDFEITYKGENVSKYTIQIDDGSIENDLARGSIKVYKVDKDDTTKVLANVTFNLSVKEDMSEILTSATTDEDGVVEFKELELGTYYLQELKTIDGYVLDDHIYKAIVTANGDLLELTVENQPTEMQFSKVDFATSEELPGATIQVTDKETGEVVDEWVSTDVPHIIKYLVEGKEYVMTETIAPEGYELAESITFVAKDGEKIVMEDKVIPPDTGSTETANLPIAIGGGSILCLGILLIIRRKMNQEE